MKNKIGRHNGLSLAVSVILATITILGSFSPATPAHAATHSISAAPLFSDDFQDGDFTTPPWSVSTTLPPSNPSNIPWAVIADPTNAANLMLSQGRVGVNNESYAVAGDVAWMDYSYQARAIQRDIEPYPGLLARYTDSNNHYMCRINKVSEARVEFSKKVGGTSTWGLPVSYTAGGDCTVNGATIHLTGAGSCTISASQAGDGNYKPARDISQTFTIFLDRFNRANGSVGSPWGGLTDTRFYKIAANRLDVQTGGALIWPSDFGIDQEASITLSTIDGQSRAQGLLLKVQTGGEPGAGAIAVVYDALIQALRVSTVRVGQRDWSLYGSTPVTFVNGDRLSARALASGNVEIYKNGTLVGTVTLNAADQAFFNDRGGRISVWTVGASNALMDDFSGGPL